MFILKKGHQPGVYVPLRALFLVGLAVSEEKTFENVNGRRRTTDQWYPVSSPMSLWLR